MKKMALVLSVLTLWAIVLCGNASAQAPVCVIPVGNGCIFGGTVVGACPGWFDCTPSGPWLLSCLAMTDQCAPANAQSEDCPTCRLGAPVAGSPINLSTGNTYIEQNDLRLPGLGGGLSLMRTWISKWPTSQLSSQIGMFGPNWRSTYEERVFIGSDNYIKYARSDGSFWSFGTGGPEWAVAAPAKVNATLTLGASYWTLTFQNGEQRHFDSTTGSLIAIIDRNGNTTQLTYDSLGRLITVTDPASRHLNFTYANPNSNLLVTSVTSDVGISLTYAYDSQNRLSQVTNPDLTTLTFAYDSQSRITTVTDSSGKVLESHTYDSSNRGLTSARANGVEAVTVTYQNP